MKDSIAYLPKDKQDDLGFLVKEILKRLPQTEYIILYGSYARGNYVRRSVRIEDGGIPTVKISSTLSSTVSAFLLLKPLVTT